MEKSKLPDLYRDLSFKTINSNRWKEMAEMHIRLNARYYLKNPWEIRQHRMQHLAKIQSGNFKKILLFVGAMHRPQFIRFYNSNGYRLLDPTNLELSRVSKCIPKPVVLEWKRYLSYLKSDQRNETQFSKKLITEKQRGIEKAIAVNSCEK